MYTKSPPSVVYPKLFKTIHTHRIFPDAKSFSDAIPKAKSSLINQKFEELDHKGKENLTAFAYKYFELPGTRDSGFVSDKQSNVETHINRLWSVLAREKDRPIEGDSLIPLPHPYIVPGGRFNEIYYWDSYFTMLGLKVSGKVEMIENMINNFAYLISQFGHIPNGNRTYFVSRSQPPFFALMVELLAGIKGEKIYEKYLPYLIAEHSFWMRNADLLNENNEAVDRLITKSDGRILNRHWDDVDTPRDEMFPDDVELVQESSRQATEVFRHIWAAGESGWDFSARWLDDPNDLASIQAGNIIPVDLNCLLYQLEKTITKGHSNSGDKEKTKLYGSLAGKRKINIISTFWNEEKGLFFDYDTLRNEKTEVYSLAGAFPLFFKIASQNQADSVAQIIENKFLRAGGLISSTIHSGQQWDAPNGWAPLQYMTIKGLMNYGHKRLAKEIAQRWLTLNESVFAIPAR